MMKQPSDSLDNWRDYFRRGDSSDIFEIIDHAIILAAADFPNEFKSRRDGIAQLLFSRNVSRRCIGCGNEDSGDRDDSGGGYGEDERKLDDDEIVDEVMRMKDILLNKDDESNGVLLRCLRKLESMSLSVDLLKDTEIGKAVNGLRRHGSDKIRELAKALFAEWKEMVDQWMNITNEIGGDERTPESAIVDEAEAFPSPPHDLDFFAPEPNGFELSQILDGLDCNGNPRHSGESKHERKSQSSTIRRPGGASEANVVGRYNKNQQMRREEVDVRQLKQTREPIVIAEQKRKLAGAQQDKLQALDPDARFEFAKRKLQESYQQHDKAKKQRTIQVLETIPKQGKTKKPLLKRPVRR